MAHASDVGSIFRSQSIRAIGVVKSDELGHAFSRRCYILANQRTLGLGHVCAAFDIDPGDKARLVARVEDLKRRMCRVESPNRVGVVREGVQAAL